MDTDLTQWHVSLYGKVFHDSDCLAEPQRVMDVIDVRQVLEPILIGWQFCSRCALTVVQSTRKCFRSRSMGGDMWRPQRPIEVATLPLGEGY
jgi:hypothetical protein